MNIWTCAQAPRTHVHEHPQTHAQAPPPNTYTDIHTKQHVVRAPLSDGLRGSHWSEWRPLQVRVSGKLLWPQRGLSSTEERMRWEGSLDSMGTLTTPGRLQKVRAGPVNGLGEGPMGGEDSSGSQLVASSPNSLFHSLCLRFVHTYSYTALDQILEARGVDGACLGTGEGLGVEEKGSRDKGLGNAACSVSPWQSSQMCQFGEVCREILFYYEASFVSPAFPKLF